MSVEIQSLCMRVCVSDFRLRGKEAIVVVRLNIRILAKVNTPSKSLKNGTDYVHL